MSSTDDEPNEILSCATCKISNANVRKCSRCHLVAYCNQKCQRRHWKEHKPDCAEHMKNLEYLAAMGMSDDNDLETRCRNHSKVIKGVKKSGRPIFTLSFTAFGLVGPGLPIPEGVPSNFALKQAAIAELSTGATTTKSKLGNMKYEGSYKAYYDDLLAYESIWMSFFDHRDNYEHAEHTCGILGTLATIYRQRGALNECEEVLDMEVKVMERYKRASIGSEYAQIKCCDCLEWKMNTIRFNLNLQTNRLEDNVPLYRKLIAYELKHNLDFEQQEHLFLITAILSKKATAANAKSLSKSDIMKIVNALNRQRLSSSGIRLDERVKERVALSVCHRCNKTESVIGEYKSCSRCEVIIYCSRKCQKDDWKTHKKVCNK